MSVDHVAVLTKDRPLSVVPIIVDYYTGSVNRPVKKQGSHGQGLFITVAARNNGATTNKAPRTDEEARCGAATGPATSAIECDGDGASMACDAIAMGRDAATAWCLTGW